MKEKITKALKSIGLNKNEIIVYLDLVKNKPSSANEIAHRVEIHKSNAYGALNELITRGFVEQVYMEKKRFFAAKDPSFLVEYLNQKEREIKAIVPFIQTLPKQEEYNAQEVSLASGVSAAREAVLESLNCNSEIFISNVPTKILDVLGLWFMDEYHKKRIKNKIPIRMIFAENFRERIKKLKKMPYTQVHHFGLSYSSPTFIVIYENVVLTIVLSNPIYVLKVRNKEIAKAYKDYFNILWKNSKK